MFMVEGLCGARWEGFCGGPKVGALGLGVLAKI